MIDQRLSRRRWLACSCAAGAAALWCASGCRQSGINKSAPTSASQPVTLRVLVVGDVPLGEAIEREWHSRTENDIKVDPIGGKDLVEASRLPGDVVVFPAAILGHLVERSLIRPLGESLLSSESVALQDIFPLTRREEIRWGAKTYALPLGSPQFILAYRPDIFARLELKPPATWNEYQAAAEQLAERSVLGDLAPPAEQPWRATAEPIAADFGGSLLLARAAGYASHPEQTTPFFEVPNLDPLIDRPPFVRALTELVASRHTSEMPAIESPVAAISELLAGRCAMALGWPGGQPPAAGVEMSKIAFAELPSSREVFHFRHNAWEQRHKDDDDHVPLLGVAARFAAVASSCSQVSAAEGLVGWLSSTDVSSRIGPASSGATFFRVSHRSYLKQWVGSLPAESARQYFETVQTAQSHARAMSTIRLPGSDRYLAALDAAVHRAALEGQKPHESLRQAADEWRKITADQGIAAQQAALSHSLGTEAD